MNFYKWSNAPDFMYMQSINLPKAMLPLVFVVSRWNAFIRGRVYRISLLFQKPREIYDDELKNQALRKFQSWTLGS